MAGEERAAGRRLPEPRPLLGSTRLGRDCRQVPLCTAPKHAHGIALPPLTTSSSLPPPSKKKNKTIRLRVGEVAESEGHHPDLHLVGYNRVTAQLSTHSVHGLTENDFIMAVRAG